MADVLSRYRLFGLKLTKVPNSPIIDKHASCITRKSSRFHYCLCTCTKLSYNWTCKQYSAHLNLCGGICQACAGLFSVWIVLHIDDLRLQLVKQALHSATWVPQSGWSIALVAIMVILLIVGFLIPCALWGIGVLISLNMGCCCRCKCCSCRRCRRPAAHVEAAERPIAWGARPCLQSFFCCCKQDSSEHVDAKTPLARNSSIELAGQCHCSASAEQS